VSTEKHEYSVWFHCPTPLINIEPVRELLDSVGLRHAGIVCCAVRQRSTSRPSLRKLFLSCFGLRAASKHDELDRDIDVSCQLTAGDAGAPCYSTEPVLYGDWRDIDLNRLTNQLLNLPKGKLNLPAC